MHCGSRVPRALETSSCPPTPALVCGRKAPTPKQRGGIRHHIFPANWSPCFQARTSLSQLRGEKRAKPKTVLYGWATDHSSLGPVNKMGSWREKKTFRETLFSSLQERANIVHWAQNSVWSRQNSPGANRFSIWLFCDGFKPAVLSENCIIKQSFVWKLLMV